MEESQLFEILDNALQKRLVVCNKREAIMCQMLSTLDLEDKEVDNLKIIQESPDKEREIMLQNKLKDAKEVLIDVYNIKRKAEKDLERNQTLLTKLKQKVSKELFAIKAVEKDCELLESITGFSPEDQLKVEKYRKINSMFKKSTGIQWDFTAPENTARGYIKNKVTNNLNSFNYSTAEPSILSEKLWTLMENTSHPDWAFFTAASDKENSKPQ